MNESPFWKRFKRNKLAIAGSVVIGLALLVTTLGYLIVPDQTPYANDQLLTIAAQHPMFKVQMAQIRKNTPTAHFSFFHRMLFGAEAPYQFIPINTYRISGDSLVLTEYTSVSDEPPFVSKFHLVDAAFALNGEKAITRNADGSYTFYTVDENQQSITREVLVEKVKATCFVTRTYVLGTDRFGRDMLSRLLLGTRVSLSVGFISVFISLVIGILMGVLAGYYRGWTDWVVSWFVNVVWSVPTLLMVLSITLVLGKGFWQVFIAVGLTMWVEVARVVRGQVLSIREKEFVDAARAMGFGAPRITFKHILPNCIGPVVIISAANFASAILMEAGLSFLGIGVQPPVPSWGNMIKDHYSYIVLNQAYLAVLPGLAIMLMVLSFNFLGDGLRDGFDTKME